MARLAAKQQSPHWAATLPQMARLGPAYLMRHGPFLAKLVICKWEGLVASDMRTCYMTKLKCLKDTALYSLYDCETWKSKRLVGKRYWPKDCIVTEEYYTWTGQWRSQSRLNIKSDLTQIVTSRKLVILGHRENKSVMLGIMDGKGRRGRPNREWTDDIREWCKQDLLLKNKNCGNKWWNLHWTLTGFQSKDHDEDDGKVYSGYKHNYLKQNL